MTIETSSNPILPAELMRTVARFTRPARPVLEWLRSTTRLGGLLLAVLLVHSSVYAMEFSSAPITDPDIIVIEATGAIVAGDGRKLRNLIDGPLKAQTKAGHRIIRMTIFLDSPGGDVHEALVIGRYLRAHDAATYVDTGAHCASACVFLLASGVKRVPQGDVGIHRPYFSAMPAVGLEQAIQANLAKVKAYLSEMNIPAGLADEMYSTPPENMRILVQQELAAYRLNQMDMVFAEQRALFNARASGLSRQEYERRMGQFRSLMNKCEGSSVRLINCFFRNLDQLKLKGDFQDL